jgi:hypothetical protein
MMKVVLAFILFIATVPGNAYAGGVLYVYPETGIYTIGEIFEIKVYADSGGQKINAAETELTFNPDALEVQKILTNDSILDSWPTPPTFSNQKGVVRFSGWAKVPYEGAAGLLVTIRFKALRNMTSNAYLAAGAILAADGSGSNIITSMKSGLYSVGPQHAEIPEDIMPTTTIVSQEPAIAKIAEAPVMPDTPAFEKTSMSMDAGDRIVVNGTAAPNTKVAGMRNTALLPATRTAPLSSYRIRTLKRAYIECARRPKMSTDRFHRLLVSLLRYARTDLVRQSVRRQVLSQRSFRCSPFWYSVVWVPGTCITCTQSSASNINGSIGNRYKPKDRECLG